MKFHFWRFALFQLVSLLSLAAGYWSTLCVYILIHPPETLTQDLSMILVLFAVFGILVVWACRQILWPRKRSLHEMENSLFAKGVDTARLLQQAKLRWTWKVALTYPLLSVMMPASLWAICAVAGPPEPVEVVVLVQVIASLLVMNLIRRSVRYHSRIVWLEWRDQTLDQFVRKNPGKVSQRDVRTGTQSVRREFYVDLDSSVELLTEEDLPAYLHPRLVKEERTHG